MSTTEQVVDIETARRDSVDYLQTHEGMYGYDMPLWVDGFAFAVELDTRFAHPRPRQDVAAVRDDTIVARGTVTELVVNADDEAVLLHASVPDAPDW